MLSFLSKERNGGYLPIPRVVRGQQTIDRYATIVCIAKNEERYIAEWLEFHYLVGITHIYLYDNSSTDRTREIIEPYIGQGRLTLVPWPRFLVDVTAQKLAYAHAIATFGARSRWMAFIDVDEFVFPARGKSLSSELQSREDQVAIQLTWHMFGTSGRSTPSEGLLIESYTMRAPIPHPGVDKQTAKWLTNVKTIVDPAHIQQVGVHTFMIASATDPDAPGPRGILRMMSKPQRHKYGAEGDIILNHYFTKSKQEFTAKLDKGPVSWTPSTSFERKRVRKSAIASAIDLDPIEDLRIQRFVPELKRRMGERTRKIKV